MCWTWGSNSELRAACLPSGHASDRAIAPGLQCYECCLHFQWHSATQLANPIIFLSFGHKFEVGIWIKSISNCLWLWGTLCHTQTLSEFLSHHPCSSDLKGIPGCLPALMSIMLSFQTHRSCLIWVYTVCHFICIFWTHYSMVKQHC